MLGAAWIIFTTVYFLLSVASPYIFERTQAAALQGSYQNGQANGYQAAVLQLGQALSTQLQGGCKEAVPVNFGTGAPIGIVSTNCLQGPNGGQQTPGTPESWAPVPTPTPAK